MQTCVSFPSDRPPPQPQPPPLGQQRAPGWGPCAIQRHPSGSVWFTHSGVYVNPSLGASRPLLPLLWPQVCSPRLCSYFCPANRPIRTGLLGSVCTSSCTMFAFSAGSPRSFAPFESSHNVLLWSVYQLSFLVLCYCQPVYSFSCYGDRNCFLNMTFSFYVANVPI